MRPISIALTSLAFASATAFAATSGSDHAHSGHQAASQPMDHSMHASMSSELMARAGEPGTASQVTRTIHVSAKDTMRFDPAQITVKPGETIRFMVHNDGRIPHEFNIAVGEAQREHSQQMRQMMGQASHAHDMPHLVSLQPGEAKELIWTFSDALDIELGCNLPGHYEAGMKSSVVVN